MLWPFYFLTETKYKCYEIKVKREKVKKKGPPESGDGAFPAVGLGTFPSAEETRWAGLG